VDRGKVYTVETFNLKDWRSKRLGLVKKRPEYKALSQTQRRIVDYWVRAHESPDEGITIGQTKLGQTFGRKYGLRLQRETVNRHLGAIEKAGVFVKEHRYRGDGGRSSNSYRLNEFLLSPKSLTPCDGRSHTPPVMFDHSQPSLERSHHEGSTSSTSIRSSPLKGEQGELDGGVEFDDEEVGNLTNLPLINGQDPEASVGQKSDQPQPVPTQSQPSAAQSLHPSRDIHPARTGRQVEPQEPPVFTGTGTISLEEFRRQQVENEAAERRSYMAGRCTPSRH
jgi:hypothetical protein